MKHLLPKMKSPGALFALITLLLLPGLGWGQYTVNFDGASDGTSASTYGFTDHNLNGITWTGVQVIIPTTPLAADWYNGVRSARLRGYNTSHMTMTSNKANGIGTISFNYRRYGTDSQVTWKVEYSTNDGGSWTQAGSDFTAPANDDIQVFSETVNVSGNARIRIIHVTGGNTSTNRRLNIDDLLITDYTGSSPSITVTPITLTGFTYVEGEGPSAEQTFTISGANLTADISVAAPTNYEISTGTGGSFSATNPITLTQTGGTVDETTICVRLKAGLSTGDYNNEVINITSSPADAKTVTCSGSVTAPPDPEPSNHVTDFMVDIATPAFSAIDVVWTDAIGTTVPAGYVIKGSAESYEDITAPVDGTEETAGPLVKIVAFEEEEANFTGLSENTTYYFKIWPFTNSGSNIDYKTDGTVPQSTATTEEAPSYAVGDFGFTAASGNWGTTNANWKQWDGSGWNTTPSGAPTINDNVYILSGNTAIVELSSKNAKNLTIETEAKLYTNNTTMGTPRYVNIAENIVCDGTIGNGSGVDDVISFNINGSATTISGSGSFTANRIRKNASGNCSLLINIDIELRWNGDSFYNAAAAGNGFAVSIASGKHLNCTGNGVTPTAGYKLNADDQLDLYGKLSVKGALTNSGLLTIKSDDTGTGSLIHSTSDVPATVERYIEAATWETAGSGWHLLSSPVAAQGISGDWTPTGAGNDYDFYAFDETASTDNWLNQKVGANNITTFVPGKGYLVAYQQTGTKTFSGNLNVADVTLSGLTNTSGSAYPGWHLAGNPFASAINWGSATWTKTNINAVAQVWSSANGSYKTTTEQGNIIPAINGFMVYTTGSGELTIPADARVHNAANWYKSDEEFILLKANDLDGQTSQSSIVRFNSAATEAYDADFDAYFLAGFAPMFYSVSGSSLYALNTLPAVSSELLIPFGFMKNAATNYSIELAKNIPATIVYLTDKKTGTVTNLTDDGVYHFTAAEGDEANRFTLHFGTLGMDDPSTTAPIHIYAYDGVVYLNGPDAKASVTITDLTGRVVMAEQVNGNGLAMLNAGNLPKGVYVVTAVLGSQVVSTKVIL